MNDQVFPFADSKPVVIGKPDFPWNGKGTLHTEFAFPEIETEGSGNDCSCGTNGNSRLLLFRCYVFCDYWAAAKSFRNGSPAKVFYILPAVAGKDAYDT